ncbi:hypothetical protein V7S43_006067 [Phytophthora oleae]|uniref:DUF659 domain-containing protein n=1 Tax=Phytophthora oleae TaxID=2107226 RepID=A0ABD3FPX4_9STRA
MERNGIVCTGCTAHGMNLLMKDIFKLEFFKDVLEEAQKLARFIKGRRGLWSRFRDTQKQLKKRGENRRRLSLTVATRWYTHERCISNVVQNRDVIATLPTSSGATKAQIWTKRLRSLRTMNFG